MLASKSVGTKRKLEASDAEAKEDEAKEEEVKEEEVKEEEVKEEEEAGSSNRIGSFGNPWNESSTPDPSHDIYGFPRGIYLELVARQAEADALRICRTDICCYYRVTPYARRCGSGSRCSFIHRNSSPNDSTKGWLSMHRDDVLADVDVNMADVAEALGDGVYADANFWRDEK